MALLQTIEDSFTFLKDMGMESDKKGYKTTYNFDPVKGWGGVEILGDISKYYLTKVDYRVERDFGQGYCIKERYMEIGQARKMHGFYTVQESVNANPQPIPLGVSFYINLYTGARSWFYCPAGTECCGYSLVIREEYYCRKLLPVIRRHHGTNAEPYDILKQIGNQCLSTCGNLLNSLYHNPYQGEAAMLFLEAKVRELLAILIHAVETATAISSVHISQYDKTAILEAQKILRDNLQRPPSINALSKQLGLNPNKLQQGFRMLTGATVMGYLRSYRMEKALELLLQDALLEDIAQQIGYNSQSRFSEAFAKTYGLLPSQYRKYILSKSPVEKS